MTASKQSARISPPIATHPAQHSYSWRALRIELKNRRSSTLEQTQEHVVVNRMRASEMCLILSDFGPVAAYLYAESLSLMTIDLPGAEHAERHLAERAPSKT